MGMTHTGTLRATRPSAPNGGQRARGLTRPDGENRGDGLLPEAFKEALWLGRLPYGYQFALENQPSVSWDWTDPCNWGWGQGWGYGLLTRHDTDASLAVSELWRDDEASLSADFH